MITHRSDTDTPLVSKPLRLELNHPALRAGIRNFSWIVDGRLARGEQPPLVEDTFTALRQLGIAEILSLRENYEPPKADWPEYSAARERQLCEKSGITFSQVACTDFAAPAPAEARDALQVIDNAVDAGRPLYLHCLAGVGRTGILTSAWGISRGQGGDWAANNYALFLEDMVQRRNHQNDRPAYYARLNVAEQLWGLESIARALGVEIPAISLLPKARQPARAVRWVEDYDRILRPWKERRLDGR